MLKFGDKMYHKNQLVLIIRLSTLHPKSNILKRDTTCNWYYYINEAGSVGAAPETEFTEFPE